MAPFFTTLMAQASAPDSPAVTLVITIVLIVGVLIAAMMSSKRGHRD